MVHKILSVIASILFGLTTLVFGVCLVYTLSSTAVQAGFDAVSSAIDAAVEQATQAMETTWDFDLGGLLGGAGSSDAGGSGAAGAAAAASGLAGMAGGDGARPDGLAATADGQAYLGWRDVVADPVGQIFLGTGVTESLLEGVAGGSISAGDALAALDETALQAIASNASNYAATVAGTPVPASLSGDVRAQMWEASSAAQSFAASVQTVVGAVRSVKEGGLGSLGDLVSAANTAVGDLQTLDACMAQAEALLGA